MAKDITFEIIHSHCFCILKGTYHDVRKPCLWYQLQISSSVAKMLKIIQVYVETSQVIVHGDTVISIGYHTQ